MRHLMILLPAVVAAPTCHGQDKSGNSDFVAALALKEFAQFQRLHEALEHMEFPQPENRIRTWKQHNTEGFAREADPGLGITIDADEWTLARIKGLWKINWKDYDLANVAVITKHGKQIQFVDVTDDNISEVADLPIRRGDAVIFLKKTEKAR